MDADLFNPIFTVEDKARKWLEARVWANGPLARIAAFSINQRSCTANHTAPVSISAMPATSRSRSRLALYMSAAKFR